MKLHLRANSANGVHTRFTVFMNEANCGELCMEEDEALFFHDRILQSTYETDGDNVYSSGRWFKITKKDV